MKTRSRSVSVKWPSTLLLSRSVLGVVGIIIKKKTKQKNSYYPKSRTEYKPRIQSMIPKSKIDCKSDRIQTRQKRIEERDAMHNDFLTDVDKRGFDAINVL